MSVPTTPRKVKTNTAEKVSRPGMERSLSNLSNKSTSSTKGITPPPKTSLVANKSLGHGKDTKLLTVKPQDEASILMSPEGSGPLGFKDPFFQGPEDMDTRIRAGGNLLGISSPRESENEEQEPVDWANIAKDQSLAAKELAKDQDMIDPFDPAEPQTISHQRPSKSVFEDGTVPKGSGGQSSSGKFTGPACHCNQLVNRMEQVAQEVAELKIVLTRIEAKLGSPPAAPVRVYTQSAASQGSGLRSYNLDF